MYNTQSEFYCKLWLLGNYDVTVYVHYLQLLYLSGVGEGLDKRVEGRRYMGNLCTFTSFFFVNLKLL